MNKHYCRTCATVEHVKGYKWQGGTVYLCDDCKRDFWQGIVSDVPENGKACKNICKSNSRTLDAILGRERGMYDVEDRSMNKKEIYNKVAGLIYDLLEVDINKEEPDATLADLDMDSLDAVELAFDLEETFDIEIPDKDFGRENYGDMTMKDLVEYVAKKMEGIGKNGKN